MYTWNAPLRGVDHNGHLLSQGSVRLQVALKAVFSSDMYLLLFVALVTLTSGQRQVRLLKKLLVQSLDIPFFFNPKNLFSGALFLLSSKLTSHKFLILISTNS